MTKAQIGMYFKNARVEAGLTQKEVANLLNYTAQNVSLWESGKVVPRMDSVFEFCNALKIQPQFFFKGEIRKLNENVKFDNCGFLSVLKKSMEDYCISKPMLEDWLNVSRPTLNKILKGEIIINLLQYLVLSEKLPLEGEYLLKKETSKKKKKKHCFFYFLLAIIFALSLAGFGCLVYFASSFKNSQDSFKEQKGIAINNTQERETVYIPFKIEPFFEN